MSFPFALVLLLTLLLASVSAQDTSIILPTTAAPTATALATAKGYSYVGCWNETVGVPNSNGARALSGGMSSANNTMTVSSCLAYCAQGYNGATMQYAGLEYGRECYCGAYLSAFSTQFPNASAHCVYACDGNGSQICGGALALTLYNLTTSSSSSSGGQSKSGAAAWSLVAPGQSAWYCAAAVVMLGVAAVL
ncbi:hypothetical protein LTS16_013256 [Friedmanniomyces endolithicus]|nr:hypothetical protein LTS16_013256 [Friedmanniomyces endolithicus]